MFVVKIYLKICNESYAHVIKPIKYLWQFFLSYGEIKLLTLDAFSINWEIWKEKDITLWYWTLILFEPALENDIHILFVYHLAWSW